MQVRLFKNEENGAARSGTEQKSICAREEKSLWTPNNGATLKQRPRLLVCGTEWQRFDCVRRGGGTAVWLYKDKTLRSSIVSPYLGHGSVLTKHHYSPSPCLYGQIMRMLSQPNREADWESHHIKQCHCRAGVSGFCCRKPEWMDLSQHFVWWYSFSVGCLCLCQCWQAQFHSQPWPDFLPKLLLESIKTLHCRTYHPRPSAVRIQIFLDLVEF